MGPIQKDPEKQLSSTAVRTYAGQRPRLRRAATWAVGAGALSKFVSPTMETKYLAIPVGAAALVGYGDALLEESLRDKARRLQSPAKERAKALVQHAYDEVHLKNDSPIDVGLPKVGGFNLKNFAGNLTGETVANALKAGLVDVRELQKMRRARDEARVYSVGGVLAGTGGSLGLKAGIDDNRHRKEDAAAALSTVKSANVWHDLTGKSVKALQSQVDDKARDFGRRIAAARLRPGGGAGKDLKGLMQSQDVEVGALREQVAEAKKRRMTTRLFAGGSVLVPTAATAAIVADRSINRPTRMETTNMPAKTAACDSPPFTSSVLDRAVVDTLVDGSVFLRSRSDVEKQLAELFPSSKGNAGRAAKITSGRSGVPDAFYRSR